MTNRAPGSAAGDTSEKARDDAGFTLIELMVYAILAVIVMSIVGGVIITTVRVQRTTTSISSATDEVQLAATTITDSVRNASGIDALTQTTAGQLLRARVASTTQTGPASAPVTSTTWKCYGWYYSIKSSTLYMASSATSMIAAPTLSSTGVPTSTGWTALASGVTTPSGTGKTVPFDDAGGSKLLTLNLLVASADASKIRISTSSQVSAQSGTGSVPTTCF